MNAPSKSEGLPLWATNRKSWPSMTYTPGPRQPDAPEPGVRLVRCVEVIGFEGKKASGQASVGAGERKSIAPPAPSPASQDTPLPSCPDAPSLACPPAPQPASPSPAARKTPRRKPAPAAAPPASPPASASSSEDWLKQPIDPAIWSGRPTEEEFKAIVDGCQFPTGTGRKRRRKRMAGEAPGKPGRPRALDDIKRQELLKLLRQGSSRNEAAKAVQVARSTIRLEARRDVSFALELRHAEVEGQEFRRLFQRLFVPGRVTLEAEPVISTPAFEKEKEYLISKGLSRAWIRRMRLAQLEDLETQVEIATAWNHLREFAKKDCRQGGRETLSQELEEARKLLAGEEIVERRFSPSGRQTTVVKTYRVLPPGDAGSLNQKLDWEKLFEGVKP